MKNEIIGGGIVALMLLGVVLVFSAGAEIQENGNTKWISGEWKRHGRGLHAGFIDNSFSSNLKERLGLPSDATDDEVKDVLKERWAQRKNNHTKTIKEKLGLPEDASTEQIREALIQQRELQHEEQLKRIKDKLGLPADASEEQVKEALQEWREENKDLIVGFGHKRWRFIR